MVYADTYCHIPHRKAAFKAYLIEVFGLDLAPWDESGFWDPLYRPFSYFDGDTVVSNVCVYSMHMTVNGKQSLVAQLSAVGTLPNYRRRGLSRKLTEIAIDWARDNHDFIFLFANEDAFGFYVECGFKRQDEYSTIIDAPQVTPRPGLVKLDMQSPNDIALAYQFALEREPVSDLLGVNNPKLFMYWCLYGLSDYVYHIPSLNTLVMFKREADRITIYDVVGRRVPPFAELYPFIGSPQDAAVEFLFMTDKLRLQKTTKRKIESNGTHLRGQFPLERSNSIFPFTAHA